MAKIAILVPYQDMCEQARIVAEAHSGFEIMCVEYNPTVQIRTRVTQLVNQGCELIVARGFHARIAR